jgi:hypothetical protein
LQTPRWVAVTEIASYDRAIGEAREQAVRRALDGYDVGVTDVTEAREDYYAPSGVGMFGLYWRKRGGAVTPADPHRDRCGLVWCDFVMANDGPLLARALAHTEALVRSFGFEPATEVHAVWPRATYIVISLAYDRDRPGDDDRAEACDRALTAYFGRFDILPARRRVGSMDLLPAPVDDSKEVFARLRTALDPAHVIAPGRYDGTGRAPLRIARAQAPETAAAQVESAHRAVLDSSRTKTAKPLPEGLLRPLFVERERYEAARRTADEFLSALLAVTPTIAGSAVWRTLLGLDEDVAKALLAQLEKSPITGLIRGVFDEDSSRYRPLGFDTSLAGIVESASLGRRAAAAGWSSELRLPSLGRGIAVLGTESSARYASTLRALERRATVLTTEALDARRSGAPVFSCDWRAVVGREGAAAARAAVLGGLPTNAPSDVLLATLAGAVVLHEEAAARRLTQRRRSFVEEVIPWTALLEDGRAQFRGARIDLLSHVIANKSSFVLRPLYRSVSEVWIGEYVADADWKKIVRRAARPKRAWRQPWVVQERVRIEHQTFPIRRVSGQVEFEGCFIGVDVPVFHGKIATGLVARAAERPRVGAGCEGTFPVAALVGPPRPATS